MNKAIRKKLHFVFLPRVLQFILFCIFLTCRWKIHNIEAFNQAREKSRPILICCWHSRFVLVSRFFKKIRLPLWAISSTHRDSEIMATILQKWGFKLIKGSSTRGWNRVLKTMIKLFRVDKTIIALTNDGPKGPPHITKKGAVSLAIKQRAQIIAVSGTASSYFTLPSWDKTKIPCCFSTIHIQFSAPLSDLQNANNVVEEVTSFIENNFIALNKKAGQ